MVGFLQGFGSSSTPVLWLEGDAKKAGAEHLPMPPGAGSMLSRVPVR